MALETFDKKSKTADCKDFTKKVPYKDKNLGKERGDTREKVYNALK